MVLMKMLMVTSPLRWEECWWWRWRRFPPPGGKFPRQDRPAGALDWFCSSSASWRRRFLPKASSWFFLERNPPYSKRLEPEGQQGAHKPPRRGQGSRPRLAGLWPPSGSPLVLLPPSIFIKSKIIPRWFSRLLDLRRIGISALLLFQARIPAAGILPLHVNLAK